MPTPAPVPQTAAVPAAAPLSAFDLFTVGIGPSSSHTVGPMRAARTFARLLLDSDLLERTAGVRAELFGSLAHTGRGHGTDRAVLLGLLGETPEDVDPDAVPALVERVHAEGVLPLLGRQPVAFDAREHIVFRRGRPLPGHPNGLRFTATAADGTELAVRAYHSVGGGFVVPADVEPGAAGDAAAGAGPEEASGRSSGAPVPGGRSAPVLPYPFASGAELLERCRQSGLPISGVVLANERALGRSAAEVRAGLLRIWAVMRGCVRRGCATEGTLPGGLAVPRRAPGLHRQLSTADPGLMAGHDDPLRVMDWVTLYALAVNEENAAGGRVVTAPTNGAAGIIPAVLHYYTRFVPGAGDDGVVRFLLTATAVGILCKTNASISGAEVGCQGEVGSASAMAAAGLAEVLGGDPARVENAAEIAMEHNLGLTCDPVGGLVQVPCIERNAVASIKAISAARIALRGDGSHLVSLDQAIATMRETGRDMLDKYKETSRGGLAVNVIEC
ncbi:L-serine ammonia-lyase [Allonocardiopsis opalescens]|uniref:L-serine dehydratase n=1 Tax=Allonocardiopsis opalescens TaxID=1144618 RepID=A0A2T0PW23_9ACTN|nr:L-serine ammonia-lyase [Allonocardiopsis opalescens]PRX95732.1 L-serine dehydratase [Allonocardiopsis opalescens]